ncbi:Crp/Fnr family transcriptional regulator [Paenibacillus sp. J2TS4]|uniref:Crp/Fnr family transcriptional regulator n=1 Tax=Paenibacillus sp. J2TS4 TaxID=2807194 RepID=UPI001B181294|nr:Crp/Fnr family transcriptional regulator [Paenibacillus sp. J2TS4]GIP31268.1 anaerobic regulatory protein [Paenibacillus sp. J2TS4]
MSPSNVSKAKSNELNYQIAHFLSKEHFEQLQKLMNDHYLTKGSHLFWEGEPAEQLYYVKKGKIKITKSTDDGKDLILFYLQEGDFFGEFASSGTCQYSYDAKAVQNSETAVIQQKDLERLISEDGAFALQFIKWMSLMQRTTESKFRDLILYGKKGALSSTLIRLTNSYGEPTEDGIFIRLKLSNTDLANMIGTSRESVNRMLAAYKSEGVIDYDKGHIVIRDLAHLKSVVRCPDCPPEICRI